MTTKKKESPITNQERLLQLVHNETSLLRSTLVKWMLDPRIDLNKECGYPEAITPIDYKQMYEREGVARRVVNCLPEECWSVQPEIYDDEDSDQTDFESAWNKLNRRMNLIALMQRADEVSGVGSFGVILLGLDDGKPLDTAVESGRAHKLLYVRTFDESVVTVSSSDTDQTSKRYGLPVTYSISFSDEFTGISLTGTVHWTRIIHIADGRRMSEVYGTPRMRPVYNRLMDIRKVLSGSGEMFWKGAFPGYSFEVNPDLKDATLDATTMRTEFQNYANGLQRYMAMTGVTAKALSPQVSDPNGHINAHMDNIAVSLGIPKRVLFGSEQAQLASSQDARTWNRRLSLRQEQYLSPFLIRPFIDRLIDFQILPQPMDAVESGIYNYEIFWPDMNSLTEQEKADLAVKRTQAIAQYTSGGVEDIIPRKEYFTLFLGMDSEEADALVAAGDEQAAEENPEEPHTHESGPVPIPTESSDDGILTNGGPGSGNFGHSGVPGQVGGSGPGGGGRSLHERSKEIGEKLKSISSFESFNSATNKAEHIASRIQDIALSTGISTQVSVVGSTKFNEAFKGAKISSDAVILGGGVNSIKAGYRSDENRIYLRKETIDQIKNQSDYNQLVNASLHEMGHAYHAQALGVTRQDKGEYGAGWAERFADQFSSTLSWNLKAQRILGNPGLYREGLVRSAKAHDFGKALKEDFSGLLGELKRK